MKIRGNTVGTPLKRENILSTPQNLTEEQKAQARENIGAISKHTVTIDADGRATFNSMEIFSFIQSKGMVVLFDGSKYFTLVYCEPYLACFAARNSQYEDVIVVNINASIARYSGGNAIYYNIEQELTDEQQAQARKNIDAMQNCTANRALDMQGHNIVDIANLSFRTSDDEAVEYGIDTDAFGITDDEGNIIGSAFEFWSSVPTGSYIPPVLRGIANGIEDYDAATVGQLNAAVGDVETALDSIIAIQNELMGVTAE